MTKRPTPEHSPGLFFAGQTAQRALRAAQAQYRAENERELAGEDSMFLRALEAVDFFVAPFPELNDTLTDAQREKFARWLVWAAGKIDTDFGAY